MIIRMGRAIHHIKALPVVIRTTVKKFQKFSRKTSLKILIFVYFRANKIFSIVFFFFFFPTGTVARFLLCCLFFYDCRICLNSIYFFKSTVGTCCAACTATGFSSFFVLFSTQNQVPEIINGMGRVIYLIRTLCRDSNDTKISKNNFQCREKQVWNF